MNAERDGYALRVLRAVAAFDRLIVVSFRAALLLCAVGLVTSAFGAYAFFGNFDGPAGPQFDVARISLGLSMELGWGYFGYRVFDILSRMERARRVVG